MTTEDRIRILVAEDQPLIRRAFVTIIEMEPDMRVIAEATNGIEAVRLASECRPDVVLTDLKMPRLNGCMAIQRIKAEHPEIHVVVLSSFDTEELIFEAISSGADAYLLKDASEHEIVSTIRAVMQGQSSLAPNVARKLVEEFRRIRPPASDDDIPDEPLSNREVRILKLIAEGRNNKQIADTVCLAEGTVKNYVSRIMEKLHVRTRTELAIKALRIRARGGFSSDHSSLFS